MKELKEEFIYILSDLNREERLELNEYLSLSDEDFKQLKGDFIEPNEDFITFKNNEWHWHTLDGLKCFNGRQINAKTLFDPKVNIINPTESESGKTIQEWKEHIKAQQEAIKNVFGVNINDLIDSLNYMKNKFNSKQCASEEQDLKCNSDLIKKPKYEFQHVESYINDNNTSNIDLIFFKEKKNGLIKVKRVTYLENINEEVIVESLNEIKDNVIKFLEQCEK